MGRRAHLPNLAMITGPLTLAGASTLPSEVSETVRCHRMSAYREDWPGWMENVRWKM